MFAGAKVDHRAASAASRSAVINFSLKGIDGQLRTKGKGNSQGSLTITDLSDKARYLNFINLSFAL